jgi:hypothetical protein
MHNDKNILKNKYSLLGPYQAGAFYHFTVLLFFTKINGQYLVDIFYGCAATIFGLICIRIKVFMDRSATLRTLQIAVDYLIDL